jgi:ssDNA-binding Zn-finger/Zn-ribbon topoisomerase 1
MRHSHHGREQRQSAYNLALADRILCSCVTCPKCGAWIVVEREIRSRAKQGKFRATCGVPECGKEFEFEDSETRVCELPHSIFERRHFYRSELREPGLRR